MTPGHWSEGERRTLIAVLYAPPEAGRAADRVLVALHAGLDAIAIAPARRRAKAAQWRLRLDTSLDASGAGRCIRAGRRRRSRSHPRSVVVLAEVARCAGDPAAAGESTPRRWTGWPAPPASRPTGGTSTVGGTPSPPPPDGRCWPRWGSPSTAPTTRGRAWPDSRVRRSSGPTVHIVGADSPALGTAPGRRDRGTPAPARCSSPARTAAILPLPASALDGPGARSRGRGRAPRCCTGCLPCRRCRPAGTSCTLPATPDLRCTLIAAPGRCHLSGRAGARRPPLRRGRAAVRAAARRRCRHRRLHDARRFCRQLRACRRRHDRHSIRCTRCSPPTASAQAPISPAIGAFSIRLAIDLDAVPDLESDRVRAQAPGAARGHDCGALGAAAGRLHRRRRAEGPDPGGGLRRVRKARGGRSAGVRVRRVRRGRWAGTGRLCAVRNPRPSPRRAPLAALAGRAGASRHGCGPRDAAVTMPAMCAFTSTCNGSPTGSSPRRNSCARASGLALGFFRDLAVGAAPDGAEPWSNLVRLRPRRGRSALRPIRFPRAGQNWALSAANPRMPSRLSGWPLLLAFRGLLPGRQHAARRARCASIT